jgi:hypothetical protein
MDVAATPFGAKRHEMRGRSTVFGSGERGMRDAAQRVTEVSMKKLALTVALACTASIGCASRPLPTARVGSAEAAVRAAREVGADGVPVAAMHLRVAQDELARGHALVHDGEYEQAEWMLVRSEADAELALALAREARQRAAADEIAARVRNASFAPKP